MIKRRILMVGSALVATAFTAGARAVPAAPKVARVPKVITQLNRTRTDEYHWLKDDNWQQVLREPSRLRADIRKHLLRENAYHDALMADTAALQERLFAEMKGREQDNESSVPVPDGPFAYFTRYAAGAQHPAHVRTPRAGGPIEVLLDVDALARGKIFYEVGAVDHSPDHHLFAYAEDDKGSGNYRLLVKDLKTGRLVGSPIENASDSFVFSPDSRYLFWTFHDNNLRPVKVMRRAVRGGDDVVVYEEKDPGMFLWVSTTNSRAFIIIGVENRETSEYHLIPAAEPTATPQLFAPRRLGQLYKPFDFQGSWYVLTNADGAVDFKVVRADRGATDRAHWKGVIPHRPGRSIERLMALKNHLIRLERTNALPRIVVRDRAGSEYLIKQNEEAYSLELSGNREFDTSVLRFEYESPTMPKQWIAYDIATGRRTLLKTQQVPSGHDPGRYVVERFFLNARDGAQIPVTTLRLRSTTKGSGAPLLLYGYGAYGIGEEASFSTERLSLVDRGWVWAIAHVRGGNEKGRGWFEDGRMKKKVNTFTDFIAVAEGLVARGDARWGGIVSYGASAGGLLVGAVANRAPEALFAGHIAVVPFVDIINTMSDITLPLTPPEWPEWGNPLKSAEDYDAIWAYSPYDQVADRAYPPIFAYGGLNDSRVTYWEPAKWIARLRDRAPRGGPYVLHIDMEAGHGGASGRFNRMKEMARDFAAALKIMGDPAAGTRLP